MKAYHTLVTGSSGGGKTTFLREIHAEADGCSLFITTKSNESNVTGHKVAGRKALNTAVARASRATDVRCRWYGASYPQAAQTAREWAHDVRKHKGWPTQIIIDECQEAPSFREGDGPVRDGLHKDRDSGIKWVISTQSPQDLRTSKNGYGPIQQCKYIVWVGETHTLHGGFLDHHKITTEMLPNELYKYTVIKPTRPPEVLYRGETNPRYG